MGMPIKTRRAQSCSTRSLPMLVSLRPQALLLMLRALVPTASPLRSTTLILKISPLTTVLASLASSDPMLREKSVWPAFTTMTSRFRDLTACQLEVFEKGDHPDDEDDDDDE